MDTIFSQVDTYKIVYLITIFSSTIFALLIISRGATSRFNVLYALTNIAVVIWALGRYKLLLADSFNDAIFWVQFLHVGSIIVHVLFIHTILVFLGIEKKREWLLIFFYANSIFILLLNSIDFIFGTQIFIAGVEPRMIFPWVEYGTNLYNLHLVNELLIPSWAFIEMVLAYKVSDRLKKSQLKLIMASFLLGFVGGNSVIFLIYDINILPFGVWFVPLNFLVMTFAIFRYNVISLRIIFAESAIFLILITLLVQMMFSRSIFDFISNTILVLIATLVSFMIVRGVYQEIETREKIEGLVKDLAKANEHLRQMEQQKSEFVSIASHQLRTPLTAIKGYASMILEGSFGALSEQAREAVEKLFRSSQRLVSLVEDFLTVSRIERGKMQFDFSSVDLRVLVGGVVKELEIDAHDKGPMISFQVESENSYVVRGDILKLKQVFINVIDNAIKFTNYGFIRILLSRNEETKKIRIAVSDTGVGMDFNTILHLFKRFDEEISSNRKGKIGMSPGGLGLYVSHQIVKAHNGNIWAQSQGIGKGSTFFVELPEV